MANRQFYLSDISAVFGIFIKKTPHPYITKKMKIN